MQIPICSVDVDVIVDVDDGNGDGSTPKTSLSFPVNMAEGVGRISDADRRRHYAIARGSAMECAAILDACRILQVAAPDVLQGGRALLIRVVGMLTRMCRA